MQRQAIVGIFTIVALVALFGVFVVLANFGTQGRYNIGVHFKTAAGLHKGALVYESGVNVGTVVSTQLLPDDFSVEVVLGINNGVDIPRNAKFLIQAPLTGDATIEIVPPVAQTRPAGYAGPTPAPPAISVLPHEVLPLNEQPEGTNPTTVQDLLAEGQGEVHRLDAMLSQLERREPKLLDTLQSSLNNANDITVTTKQTVAELSRRIDTLTSTLQTALTSGSANLDDITAQLDQTVRSNRGHVDAIIASLDGSARALNQTAESVRGIAGDPRLHDNLIRTTQGIAETATTVASIAHDFRNVTGNPQTQAQLRDTIANADAAVERANSILGSFGGKSSVYGVDPGATPAPLGSPRPGGAPGPLGSPAPGNVPQNVKGKLGALVKNLVALQIRISELDSAKANTSHSPILTNDRGPQTDFNAVLLPQGSTSLFAGANDIGSGHTTFNFAGMASFGKSLRVGGGVLYSRLGARAVYAPSGSTGKGVGAEVRLYDLRHPTADGYLNYGVGNGLTVFGGERDIFHDGRRTTFGLQYQF